MKRVATSLLGVPAVLDAVLPALEPLGRRCRLISFHLGVLRKASRPLNAIAFGLVIGGALGNMIDRARFGAVVDFFDFSGPWFGWMIGSWPVGFPWVFNVADASSGTAL